MGSELSGLLSQVLMDFDIRQLLVRTVQDYLMENRKAREALAEALVRALIGALTRGRVQFTVHLRVSELRELLREAAQREEESEE